MAQLKKQPKCRKIQAKTNTHLQELLSSMCVLLCTTVLHNTAQTSVIDNLPSYPRHRQHCSDVVCLRTGGTNCLLTRSEIKLRSSLLPLPFQWLFSWCSRFLHAPRQYNHSDTQHRLGYAPEPAYRVTTLLRLHNGIRNRELDCTRQDITYDESLRQRL